MINYKYLLISFCAISWAVFADSRASLESLHGYFKKLSLYEPAANLPAEKWAGGSLEAELKLWDTLGSQVLALQQSTSEKLELPPGRLFHAKSNGCYLAKLKLNPGRPEWTKKGLYSSEYFPKGTPQEYQALIRFSNGLADTRASDRKPDLRGVAVKIFVPKGFRDPLTGTTKYFSDLTSVNTPWPMTQNPQKFMEFAEVNLNPFELVPVPGKWLSRPKIWVWALENPGPVSRIYRGSIRSNVESLATERWWSQHAYLHGEGEGARSVKFNFRPMNVSRFYSPVNEGTLLNTMVRKVVGAVKDRYNLGPLNENVKNSLRRELADRARRGFGFILSLQRDVDAKSTPLENTSFEWTEELAPSVAVAQLEVAPQEPNPERDRLCEEILFTPGNFHPAHRPLEEMGRFRIFAYLLSHMGRNGRSISDDPEKIKALWSTKPNAGEILED